MKNVITSTIFAALLFPAASFAAGVWANEPATATALLDCPFNDASCGGQLWVWGAGEMTQPAGTPLSAPNAVASHLAKNSSSGGQGVTWPNLGKAVPRSEIYVGFWWKMNADFQGYYSGSNKLFFIRNFDFPNGKDPTNGVFTLIGRPDTFPWQLVFGHNTGGGLDNSHVCALDMGLTCYPNVGSAPIYPDTWYQVEAYVKSSTCSTCRDGIARWWVNGTLIGNYTTLNYGSGNMGEFTINHTWDGQPSASCYDPVANPGGRDCSREWFHYFDHLRISAPNCPSGGCSAPAYLLITSTLAPTRTGTPYTATLAADGGTKPYTWFLNSGNLPTGLSLNQSTGVISGTPTCVGRSDFTIRVTDASQPALTATKSYSLITSGTGTTCPSAITGGVESGMAASSFTAKAIGGKVTFNFPAVSSAQYRLSVYDLTGKRIYEQRSLGQKETSITKNLESGVYLARFVMGTKASVIRFQVMN